MKITEKIKIIIVISISMLVLAVMGILANYEASKYRHSKIQLNRYDNQFTSAVNILNLYNDMTIAYSEFMSTANIQYKYLYDVNFELLKVNAVNLKNNKLVAIQLSVFDSIISMITNSNQIQRLNIENKLFSFPDNLKSTYPNGNEKKLTEKVKYNLSIFISNLNYQKSETISELNYSFSKIIHVVTISVLISLLILTFTLLYILKIYTRLTNTEKFLLESQKTLSNILEVLPVGVVLVYNDKEQYTANNKATELLKTNIKAVGSVKELIETKSSDSNNSEQTLMQKLLIEKAFKGEKTTTIDEFNLSNEDTGLTLRVSSTPLYNDNGEIEYAISVFDDISTIKKSEKELIEAKKLVEQSLRLKESFLTNMSHEIRTPMNAILGFTELLSEKDLGHENNDYIKTIQSSGENLLRLLNDILDFSRLEANMMAFEEHPFSIVDVINSICTLYFSVAKDKGLKLEAKWSNNIPDLVLGDSVRLTQVITNIVSNAIKFTEFGKIIIATELISKTPDINTIQFKIKDTGVGIPPDDLERIFQRFEQGRANTARIHGGTGLGLSIVEHIVRAQGGRIDVKSDPGSGSEFMITLSFKNIHNYPQHLTTGDNDTLQDYSFIADIQILLVEDNPINIKLLKNIFKKYDLNVDVAQNGNVAIDKLKQNKYDIILMDIEMPEINGYSTTNIIRTELKLNTPIIAITAHALAGEKEKCIQAGMNDYLSKPININSLIGKLKRLTDVIIETHKPDKNMRKNIPEDFEHQNQPCVYHDAKKVINLDYLHQISENNKELEKEILHLFLEQAKPQIEELKTAYMTSNFMQVKYLSHKMKSSTSMLLGDSYRLYFEHLEKAAIENKWTAESDNTLSATIDKMRLAFKELQEIIKADK